VSGKTEGADSGGGLDLIKWLLSIGLIVGGIYAYYHFEQFPLLYRVLGLLAIVGIGLLFAVWTRGGGAFWTLFLEAFRSEIRKVVWPTGQETRQTTLIVLVVVVIMAVILWLLDWVFSGVSSMILG
jgi:preprotein translocase subunit SecE